MKDDGGDYNLYGYQVPVAGDWTYGDALARNPSALARDFWVIPARNNTLAMTEADADGTGDHELAALRVRGGGDQSLFLFNAPVRGDWSYGDAQGRNPSPLAKDLWQIPAGNDTTLIADGGSHIASMKNEDGDHNLYLYTSPVPGDWTYSDALWRNPSAPARDFWQVPSGNDAVAMCGLDTVGDGHSDSLLVVRNVGGDYRAYLWNMPEAGDWSYTDALARNPSALAQDLWQVPAGNDIALVVGIGGDGLADDMGVMRDSGGDFRFSIYNAPAEGDWSSADAQARNPSPLARDFWQIPAGNNTLDMAAPN